MFRYSQLRFPWTSSPIYTLVKRNSAFTYRYSHNITMSRTSPPDADSPWGPNYTIVKNQNPSAISREEVLTMLGQGQKPGKDFLLIDLRQADHIVGDPNQRAMDEELLTVYLEGQNYSRIDQLACAELVSRFLHSTR